MTSPTRIAPNPLTQKLSNCYCGEKVSEAFYAFGGHVEGDMMSTIPLFTLVLVVGALVWPFAVGLGAVLWTKARAKRRAAALILVEDGVRQLYASMQEQPIPPRLAVTVDAMQEAEEMAAAKAAVRRQRRALAAG